jgi:hypothetical protein
MMTHKQLIKRCAKKLQEYDFWNMSQKKLKRTIRQIEAEVRAEAK